MAGAALPLAPCRPFLYSSMDFAISAFGTRRSEIGLRVQGEVIGSCRERQLPNQPRMAPLLYVRPSSANMGSSKMAVVMGQTKEIRSKTPNPLAMATFVCELTSV